MSKDTVIVKFEDGFLPNVGDTVMVNGYDGPELVQVLKFDGGHTFIGEDADGVSSVNVASILGVVIG